MKFPARIAVGILMIVPVVGLAQGASGARNSSRQSTETFAYLGLKTAVPTPTAAGVVVIEVDKDGPALGVLKANDVLLKVDDHAVAEPKQLDGVIRSYRENTEVVLTFLRGGKEQKAKVKLAERSNSAAVSEAAAVTRN